MTAPTTIQQNLLNFLSIASSGSFMRSGLVQSPMSEKNTGLPCHAAASIRNGRVVPGQVPVQAMRVSEVASEFHAGSAF